MNKNSGWRHSIEKEISQLVDEYKCFKIMDNNYKPPPAYLYIPLLWTFAVKFDGRKRARCVAGGHKTPKIDTEDSTSTQVSLETIKIVILAAYFQGLYILAGDITSAYIQSYTKEKVYTIAGPEFGELEGSVMIIDKALYGLQGSGNA